MAFNHFFVRTGADALAGDARRRFLLRALAAGLYAAGGGLAATLPAAAQVLGRVPGELPAGRSVYDLRGTVLVNGVRATPETVIGPNDRVETGPDSTAIFAVGRDAFLARAGSRVELSGTPAEQDDDGGGLVDALRMVTGKLLSVFGRRRHRVETGVATIGIRGTGLYVEAEPDRSYVCTCYGTSDIGAESDPASRETIVSEHHDAPRYVLAAGATGKRIRPAPFKNHDDIELMLLEALVGRVPPFRFGSEEYGAPRRGY